MEDWLDRLIHWILYRNRRRRPSKDELVDMVDQYLVGSNGYGDGVVIRHRRGGYQYYITRSVAGTR